MERSPLNLKDFALAYETISPFWAKIGIQWMNLCCLNTPSSWKHPRVYISQRSTIFMFRSTYIFPRCVRSVFLVSFQMNKILGGSDLWNPNRKFGIFLSTKPTWCAYHFKVDMIPLTDYNCSYRCFVDCQFVDSLLKKEYGALWPLPSLWIFIFPCQLTILE